MEARSSTASAAQALPSRDPGELLATLAALPPASRDAAVEAWLGIGSGAPDAPPGDHLVGYHASGVAPIVRAVIEAPIVATDVVIDLGSGLGKVVMLASLLTGARARGVELQPDLADRSRERAEALSLPVTFTTEDASGANLHDGTVFFLYAPFTGPTLSAVVRRLAAVAADHAIVVVTLGIDLPPAPFLSRRAVDAFWLGVYDGALPGASPRRVTRRAPSSDERRIALELPAERAASA